MFLNSISFRILTYKRGLKVENQDFKEIYGEDQEFDEDVDSLDLDE